MIFFGHTRKSIWYFLFVDFSSETRENQESCGSRISRCVLARDAKGTRETRFREEEPLSLTGSRARFI